MLFRICSVPKLVPLLVTNGLDPMVVSTVVLFSIIEVFVDVGLGDVVLVSSIHSTAEEPSAVKHELVCYKNIFCSLVE